MATRDQDLDAALEKGELAELPPNQPKGILGEKGFDLYKVDEFEPDLNSGISQENDLPVVWLGVILAYLLFFPLAYWLLWRSPLFTRRAKTIASIVGAVGVLVAAVLIVTR